MQQKRCCTCKVHKDLEHFGKCKSNVDGLQIRCLLCSRGSSNKYYQNNKEEHLKRTKLYASRNREYYTEYSKQHYKDNIQSKKEYAAKWHSKNKEHVAVRLAKWRKDNPEKYKEQCRRSVQVQRDKGWANTIRWQRDNPNRVIQHGKVSRKNNHQKRLANNSKRRAARLRAVPSWFGEFDELVVNEAYDKAKSMYESTGVLYHVDHIVPLQGKFVCGLHCATNVQVLPAKLNLIKSNIF